MKTFWHNFKVWLIGLVSIPAALAAPVVPSEVAPAVWFVRQDGCFVRYVDIDGDAYEKPMSCEEYWKTANTPNYPQPKAEIMFHAPLAAKKAKAAIAFDASTEDADACVSGATSASWSHTTTGSNLVLLAGAAMDGGGGDIDVATYNAVSLTSIRRDTANGKSSEIWYLVAPDTGANTVTIEFTGTPTMACGYSLTLTGVDQTSALDANNGTTATNQTSVSVSVTTIADNAWVADIVAKEENGFCTGLSAGAGQTERQTSNGSAVDGGMSTEGPNTPAGAVAMSWTATGANCGLNPANWAISAASFAPAAGGGATNPPIKKKQGVIFFE